MIEWLQRKLGRGSKVDKLIRAIPDPSEILRRADAWVNVLHRAGEAGFRWDPADSRLLQVVRDGADALDLLGPLVGARGSEKLAVLTRQVRVAAAVIDMTDDVFDTWWVSKGRPILEQYLEACRRR